MESAILKKTAISLFLLVGLVVLAAAANMLASMALFASYRENPANATFWAIENALSIATDDHTRRRIYGCIAFASFLVFGAPFAMAMAYRKKGSDLHGSARFATAKDLAKEGLYAPKGILLGMHDGKLLRLPGYDFVLLAAPTRTGKGVGFVVPNLLVFPDSAVVLDIKGENYNLTSAFRRQHLQNEVYYLNPFSETTHRWNPLSYVRKDPNFMANDLMGLATLLYPESEKDPFWPSSARNLFVGLGLLVLESPGLPKTFGEILRQASGKGRDVAEYLKEVIDHHLKSEAPLTAACTDALGRFLNNSETVLKGILATLVAPLTPWGNAVVDKATSADDFDLRDVRKKKMTIYLHIPASEVVQSSFFCNLFFSQLINENVKELPEENPELKYECMLAMDETTAVGKIAILAKAVGFMAGYRLRICLIIQDTSQLEETYGKADAKNIISNMGASVYFTPSTVEDSERISKMIGNQTVTTKNESRSNVGALNAGQYGVSETESYASRAVMLPQELRELSKDKAIVARAGMPIAMVDKIKYFSDDFFSQRFNAVPMHKVFVGDQERAVPIPLKLPPDNWTAYRSQVARSNYYLENAPKPPDRDLPTDQLLDNINSGNLTEAEIGSCVEELAKRKFMEFTAQFDLIQAATLEDADKFELDHVEQTI